MLIIKRNYNSVINILPDSQIWGARKTHRTHIYIYILLYATAILLMHDVLTYIGLINVGNFVVHHHFYQPLGNISEHQHGIWSYNTIDLRFQKLNLTPKIFPMLKKHVHCRIHTISSTWEKTSPYSTKGFYK